MATDAEPRDPRRLVHPSLIPALDFIPVFATEVAGLADNRAMVAAMEAGPTPPGVERSEITVPGRDGAPDVRCLLYRPTGAAPRLTVLHLHGGGFVIGRPEMNDARNLSLVTDLGCAVLSVDYRLAPEHPWPAALDDALTAYQWLLDQLTPGAKLVVLGESAGGGLAASLSHRLRDFGRPLPALQALLYPMLDPRSGIDGVAPPVVGDHVWTRANNRFAWSAYLADAEADAGAAPALTKTVEGLPPTFILVGALDLFLEEDIDYARRLACAGVPTELHVLPGAYHGFDMAGPSACADQLIALLERALREA